MGAIYAVQLSEVYFVFFFFLNFDHYRKAEDSEEGEKHLSMLKCEKKSLENLVRSSFWK